jgi:hypothetical protein
VSPSGAPSSDVGEILVVIVGDVSTHADAVLAPVKVFAASVRAIVAEVVGNVIVVESVPDNVSVFVTAKVFPSVSVNVEPVAGCVSVILLIDVAVATPRTGVVSVGDAAANAARRVHFFEVPSEESTR